MAEGYLVRRTGSGGGSAGTEGLNIWTGSSAPSDEVGVWANSTLTDYTKYIIPYGSMATDSTWIIDNTTMPTTSTPLLQPCYENGVVYLPFANTNSPITLWSHDVVTQVYTQIATSSFAYTNFTPTSNKGASAKIENLIYIITTGTEPGGSGDNHILVCSFDIDTGTATFLADDNGSMGDTAVCITSALVYSGMIYFGYTYYYNWSSKEDEDYIAIGRYSPSTNSLGVQYSLRVNSSSSNFSSRTNSFAKDGFITINANVLTPSNAIHIYSYGLQQGYPNQYGVGQSNSGGMFDDADNLYSIIGSSVYALPKTTPSGTNAWSVVETLPISSNGKSYSSIVDTGTEYIMYQCGPSTNQVLRYNYTLSNYKYPSIIVECGTEQNQADIITGEDGTATINVYRVYENQSGTPIQVTGQVRTGGQPWADIQ